MRCVHDIIDLPVIDAQEGKEVGIIIDVVIESGINQIAGVVLKSNQQEYLVPLEQLYSLGADYIIIKELYQLLAIDSQDLLTGQKLIGTPVVTSDGDSLGVVKDILLTEKGELNGYELSDGLVQDILNGREILTADQKITYGDQKMIINNYIN